KSIRILTGRSPEPSCKENDRTFLPQKMCFLGVSENSVYGLLLGLRGSRTISQTRGLGVGCRRPCATRISAERIALSRSGRALGPQIRMSRELTVGLGHLSSHPRSASASSLGCRLAFSSGGGFPLFKRLKMSTAEVP